MGRAISPPDRFSLLPSSNQKRMGEAKQLKCMGFCMSSDRDEYNYFKIK